MAEEPETDKPNVNPYKMGTYDIVRMRINKLMDKPVIEKLIFYPACIIQYILWLLLFLKYIVASYVCK